MENLLIENYSSFFEQELINEIQEVSSIKTIKEEDVIINIGNYIISIPLLLNGTIKISREDEKGDELLLYYLEVGDTCAMTLSCCMEQTKSKIKATAETDVEVLMIPKAKMSEWLGKYHSWQRFVLQSYHNRVEELVETIDNIAFLNMDMRLLKYLKDKAIVNKNEVIRVTHQEIANDLYTSRVVISRLLKTLEKNGKVELYRNSLKVIEL